MAQEEAERYVHRFNISPDDRLKERVTDADIIEIAKDLIYWEEKMAGPLELSGTEIHDINHIHRDQPGLQRKRVLEIWKSKKGLDATYELLLVKCLEGRDTNTAEKICRLLAQGQNQSGSPPLSPSWQQGQVGQYGGPMQGIPPQQASGGQPQDNYYSPQCYPPPQSSFGQQGGPPQGSFGQQGGPPQDFDQQGGPPQGFDQQGGPPQDFGQQGGLGQQGGPPHGGGHPNANIPFRGSSSSSPETDGPAGRPMMETEGSSDTSTMISRVVDYVKDVKHVRAFGLFLKIDPGKIDEIESSPRDTMTQIIQVWFKYPMSDDDRWEELGRVLLEPAIREPRMASSLKPHLRRGSLVDSAISVFSHTSRPSITSSSSQHDQITYIDSIGADKECSIPNVLNCIEPYPWYDIGLFLNLPEGKLEEIRQSYHPANYKAHMVELWYRYPNDFCWAKLRDALKQVVGKWQRRESGASVNSPSLSPTGFTQPALPTTPEVPIPISYWTESLQVAALYGQKEFETKLEELMTDFENIQEGVLEILEKEEIKPTAIERTLKCSRASLSVQITSFQNLRTASGEQTVGDIFGMWNANVVWSFLDFQLLERLVNKYGPDIKPLMNRYIEEVRDFRKRTTVSMLMSIWTDGPSQTEKDGACKKMILDLNKDPDKCTLEELESLRKRSRNLLRQFPLSQVALVLFCIRMGCISLTWIVRSDLVEMFKEALDQCVMNGTYFKENGIISIELDGVPFMTMERASKEGIVSYIDRVLKKWNPDININKPVLESKTLLILAAENGHECVVSSLLEAETAQVDINYQTEDKGWSALFFAYANEHIDGVAKLLLEYEADITLKDKSGKVAAEMNPTKKLSWAKKGAQQAAKSMKNLAIHLLRKPKLLSLCHRNDYEGVRYLLEQHEDIDVNPRDTYLKDWTPLMHVCENGNFQIVKLLLEHKADIHLAARNEWTALPIACSNNFVRIAYLLLRNGAEPNRVIDNKEKFTPLLYISDMEHVEPLARALLKYGANLEMATRKSDWTPLIYACHYGRKELVQLYLDSGANFDHTAKKGWTAMMAAARFDRKEIVNLLIDKGASMELTINDAGNDVAGESSLHIASYTGSPSAVRALIEHGADPNVVNRAGLSPLMVATSRNKPEVVEALCESETIDVNLQQKDTRLTALFIAAKNGNVDIFGKLLRCGAHEEVNSISVRDAANLFNRRNIVMELDRYKAEVCMHMETETDIQIQQEVSQVEAQAKAPAEELTPPMLKVTPTPVQETTSVQVEEEIEESHTMAATADVVAPALEGPSLEVLDPQLPQETEHENVPVPIEEERDDQTQKASDTSSLFDAEDVLPQPHSPAPEQEDITQKHKSEDKQDLAKAEKEKNTKKMLDLLATLLTNYHKNFKSSLNDSGVSEDTGKGVRPVEDIYHQYPIEQS